MKSLILTASMIGLALVGNSCRQELVEELASNDNTKTEVLISDGSVVNGRLFFSNVESLQYAYDRVKDEEDEIIANYIDSKGILSLRPITTPNNERLIEQKMSLRLQGLKSDEKFVEYKGTSVFNEEEIEDDIDDLEDIIGDDAFAAFLNSDAEIQVADKIYKYTDVGLFIVKDDKYSELTDYLSVKKISNNLLIPTDENVREQYVRENFYHNEGNITRPVHRDIEYFIIDIPRPRPIGEIEVMPIDDFPSPLPPKTSPVPTPPKNNPSPNPIAITKDPVDDFVNSLSYCNPRRGFFRGIFGQNNVCINNYEKRRRIKLKAFNYNYLLVYHTGVKVKHQYRGWTGGWRKEKVNEIRLGVEDAQFIYDYRGHQNLHPQPSVPRLTTIYNNNSRLIFDANVKWEPGFYPNIQKIVGYSIQGYPSLLKDNIYIEDIIGNIRTSNSLLDKAIYDAIKAGNKELASDNLNKKFIKETLGFLEQTWKELGKKERPNNEITYSLNIPEIGLFAVNKRLYRVGYNTAKVDKTFDWGFHIGIDIGSDGKVSPNTSGGGLKKPENFRADLYGVVRRGNNWYGVKMITQY